MNPERLQTLAALETAIWGELTDAARTKGHGWRQGVLATVGEEDGTVLADARTVVIRDVDAATRMLLIYTDARSPKVQQIQAHPQGQLVLWSAPLSWQLRLTVSLRVETVGLRVSSRWAQVKLTHAAQDYMTPWPPGSQLESPTAEAPQPERTSRDHFAVIAAEVTALDWLELHAEGHRRARFSDASGGVWLTP